MTLPMLSITLADGSVVHPEPRPKKGGAGSGNFGHAALASIKEHGLSATRGTGTGADEYARQQGADMGGRAVSVYATESETAATTYARYASEVNDDAEPILLKIEIPREFRDAYGRSEDHGDAIAFTRDIPPEWIVGYAAVEPSIWAIPEWRKLKSAEPLVVYSVVLVEPSIGKSTSPRAQRIEKLGITKD